MKSGVEYFEMLRDERKDKIEMFPCPFVKGRNCTWLHCLCRMWAGMHCQLYDDYKAKKEE